MSKRFLELSAALFLVIGFLASCGGKSKGDAYISGNIKGGGGNTLFLEQLTPQGVVLIDSTKIEKDGSFRMKKSAKSMDYYRLRLGKTQSPAGYASPKNEIIFISDSTEKLTLETEMVTEPSAATGKDENNFKAGSKVSGSKETDMLNEINAFLLVGEKTIDSLNQIYQNNPQMFNQPEAEKIFNSVQMNRTDYMRKFVDSHPENFVALQALPFLNPDTDLDRFKSIYASLNKKYPANGWVINLGLRVEQLTFLAPGTPAPNFSVLTPDDKPIALKD